MSVRLPDINSYFRSFSWYVLFGVLTSVIPILFLPFLTSNLEASDFGLITSFNIIAMIMGNLIRLDLNNSLKRFYAKEKNDFGRFVTGALFCSLIVFLAISSLVAALSLFGVSELLNVPIGWLYLAAFLAFFRSQIMNLHHLWQVRNQSIRYGVWALLATASVYLLFSGLILLGEASWKARVISEVVVALAGFAVAVFFLYKNYDFLSRTNLSTIKLLLVFSLPIVPGSFLSYYFITSDRIFISGMFSASQLGLYSLAFQVCSLLEVFFRAVIPVWESWLFQDRGDRFSSDFVTLIVRIMAGVFFLLVGAGLVSPFFIGFIAGFLIDEKMAGMTEFLAPSAFAILAAGFYRLTVPLSLLINKTRNITYSNVIMLIVSLPTMLILINYLGVAGAGFGVAVTFFIGSVVQMSIFIRNFRSS